MPRDDFHPVGNISRRHLSMNEVPRSLLTARILIIPNQEHEHMSLIKNNKGTMPSMLTTLWFAIVSCGYLIEFMKSLQVCSRNSFLMKWGMASISSKLTTVSMGFDVTLIQTLERKVALLKKDVTSCRHSSDCRWKTYY